MSQKNEGWGTQKQKLDSSSMRDFDCCCLGLQPCIEPLITPQGFIFDKEAIYEYILHHKKEKDRQMKLWEEDQRRLKEETAIQDEKRQKDAVNTFVQSNQGLHRIHSDDQLEKTESFAKSTIVVGGTQADDGRVHSTDGSFWIPQFTPQAKKRDVDKPSTDIPCPMTGKPLRLKQLYKVNFKKAESDKYNNKADHIKKSNERYVCSISGSSLTNNSKCFFLKTSGTVVLGAVVKNILKKDMIDPCVNKPLKDKDIIEIQREGTGYAGGGGKLEAVVKNASLMS